MSTPILHALTALFIFLLVAEANVRPWHEKAIHDNRPRLRIQGQLREDEQQQDFSDGGYGQSLDRLPLKDDAKEVFRRYEEKLSQDELTMNTPAAWSKPQNQVSPQREADSSIEKQNHDQIYVQNKLPEKTEKQEVKSKSEQTNTDSVPLQAEEAKNSTSAEFWAQVDEDDNTTLSHGNFSVEHSTSDSEGNSSTSLRDARCPTCRMRDDDRIYRIEHLKQQILSTLQIKKLPNATGVSIPKVPALAHLYEMDSDMMSDSPYKKRTNKGYGGRDHDDYDYEEDFIVKTERVFTIARPAPMDRHFNLTDSVYFSPPIQLYTSKIKTAYLWFYIRKVDTRRPFITLTVERILPESVAGQRLMTKTVFSQKLFRDKAFGWKRIDMRNTVRQWVKHPILNYGLKMRAEDDAGNNLIVLPPSADLDKGYEPWLDTRIEEPRSNSRSRRSDALVCSTNSTESRCCRYPLYVGFAEFGWDWIIAPTHVKADYCSGECRMSMQDSTPYSWINQQMPGTEGSCCTPTKMSALPLLYFDESMNVLYQILQNIKVDKCGCA
uniref:Myostatin n=1 Tax=Onchidium reevesii TaxID=2547651 RepID=A0A1C9T8N1_9EUPU|nr:myostatin [Onchidium reevesii]